jgi:hypothetical protein
MPEAHSKPRYMLESLKAQSASYAKISEIKVDFMKNSGKIEENKEEVSMTNSISPVSVNEVQPEIGNQQVTQFEIGWLAGFIDGEGYIGIQPQKTKNNMNYSVAMQVSNTDEVMILKAQSIIQKMGVNPYIKTHGFGERNQPKRKIVYVLVVHRMKPLVVVLQQVLPFLTGLKAERAKLVIEYCLSRADHFVKGSHYNVMTEREVQIVELCVAKQKRGTSETTREAQLERSKLMLAKAYVNKKEYNENREKDPVVHARRIELQQIRRGTPKGREKEREYRMALNIRRKEALRSVLADDDIVRPYARAMGS